MARSINYSNIFYMYCWDFLHVYLPDRMGRSKHTIASYVDTLTIFKDFLNEQKKSIETFTFNECTTDLVFNFIDWLKARGCCNTTINHRITGIKGYLYYASTKDIALNSIYLIISKIKPLKCQVSEKKILSDKQMALILNQAENNAKGIRNRVLLLTLFETAMRVSEGINIKIQELYINRDNPYISVHGKGNKERNIPISKTLSKVLIKYIEKYKENDSVWLFSSCHNGQQTILNERRVQQILDDYATKARKEDPSIPEKVHPHMLRRSRATILYQSGLALELVSSLLGHNQISTSKIYASPSMEMLRKEIEKSLPEESYKQKPKWKDDKDFAKKIGLR